MILLDAIYDKDELDYIRGNGKVYIHSHSRCGTAPSLVEAMNLGNAILSYNVPTNKETTKGQALYFTDSISLCKALNTIEEDEIEKNSSIMKSVATKEYTWQIISSEYKSLIENLY